MEFRKAERKQVKIKMAIQGPSGSGKTYSALKVAFGLSSDWSKIVVIDTENHSSDLYAHLGGFNVIDLTAPYTPERYLEAILEAERQGMEVIIIDSISHEWDANGGILDTHNQMAGNSFTNWHKLTPRHNAFVHRMLHSRCHVISTIRTKQEYVLTDKNGKMVPEKVGMKGITRDGMDYEFTIVFDTDIKHFSTASKDRTGLFMDKPSIVLNEATGHQIMNWCRESNLEDVILDKITTCKNVMELKDLYTRYPEFQSKYFNQFSQRKAQLEKSISNHQVNLNNNGVNHQ